MWLGTTTTENGVGDGRVRVLYVCQDLRKREKVFLASSFETVKYKQQFDYDWP